MLHNKLHYYNIVKITPITEKVQNTYYTIQHFMDVLKPKRSLAKSHEI